MVNAILYQARTGCQWRYLPGHFGPWGAIWQQFRRWRAKGVWEKALTLLRKAAPTKAGRDPEPSMVTARLSDPSRADEAAPGSTRPAASTAAPSAPSEPCSSTTSASPSPPGSTRPTRTTPRPAGCSSIIPFPVCPGSARCSPTSGSSRWSRAFSAATRSRSPPNGGASRTSPRASSPPDRCGRSRTASPAWPLAAPLPQLRSHHRVSHHLAPRRLRRPPAHQAVNQPNNHCGAPSAATERRSRADLPALLCARPGVRGRSPLLGSRS